MCIPLEALGLQLSRQAGKASGTLKFRAGGIFLDPRNACEIKEMAENWDQLSLPRRALNAGKLPSA
jgi:hypothetical protein